MSVESSVSRINGDVSHAISYSVTQQVPTGQIISRNLIADGLLYVIFNCFR